MFVKKHKWPPKRGLGINRHKLFWFLVQVSSRHQEQEVGGKEQVQAAALREERRLATRVSSLR